MKMENTAYLAVFEPAENGYSVYFPDLPGCTSFGETFERAQKQAAAALRFHLYGLRKDGEAIPVPSKEPEIYPETAEGYLAAWISADQNLSPEKQV